MAEAPTVTAVEALARRFHETYERLAPSFGYETRPESSVPWEEVPFKNRLLMCAVAGEVLQHLLTHTSDPEPHASAPVGGGS